MTNTTPASDEPSYEIASEDQHFADQLDAMDPISSPPPSASFPDHWRPNIEVTAKALPPHLQAAVREKIAASRMDEGTAVAAVLNEHRVSIRLNAGISSDALPLHDARMQLAYDYGDLEREFDRISEDLMDKVGYRTVADPQTGETTPEPIYRVEGAKRAAFVARQEELARQMRLLHDGDRPGIEGARRLKQARFESVKILKQRAEQVEDAAEVERLSAEAIRKERIAKHVDAKVRMARNAS